MSRMERPKYARNKFLREERQKKQDEAAIRKAASDARTPEQQIARLDAKGYVATKERAKLAARIAARKGTTEGPFKRPEAPAELKPAKFKKAKRGKEAA